MNHTIQLTTEQFEALQSGHPITIEPPKPAITKWNPRGGNIQITNSLNVTGKWDPTSAGMKYPNTDKANSAAKAIRSYARQLAWVSEHCDGWVADWDNLEQSKYFVYIAHNSNKVNVCSNFMGKYFGAIYMSHANATKLAQLMNDGIVEF